MEAVFNILDEYLFSSVYFNDAILIHVFEDMRGVHENADSPRRSHTEENIELESVNYHGHVLPIFARLKQNTQGMLLLLLL